MRFNGKDQQNVIYGILLPNKFLELLDLLNPLLIIHSRHNAVNFGAQKEIIGSEPEITE